MSEQVFQIAFFNCTYIKINKKYTSRCFNSYLQSTEIKIKQNAIKIQTMAVNTGHNVYYQNHIIYTHEMKFQKHILKIQF